VALVGLASVFDVGRSTFWISVLVVRRIGENALGG